MNILNNFNIIFNDIKNIYQTRFNEFINVLSAFITILLIRFIIIGLNNLFINDNYSVQYFVFYIATSILMMGLEIGLIKLIFKFIDSNIKSQFEIFNYFHLLKKYFFGLMIFYFLLFLSIIPGLIFIAVKTNYEILSIIQNSIDDIYFQQLISSYFTNLDFFIIAILTVTPLLYVTIRLCFWNYSLIDQNTLGSKAIQHSLQLTKGKELEIILYFIIFLIFNVIGVITIIGMLITIPSTYLFFAKYYRLLKLGI